MTIHKKLLMFILVTAMAWSVPTQPFFFAFMTSDALRTMPSRIACMTRSAFSSLRNFFAPSKIAATVNSRIHTVRNSNAGQKAANYASTVADKVGRTYDDAKKRAQATKEAVAAKVDRAKQGIEQLSIQNRISLNRVFGEDVAVI